MNCTGIEILQQLKLLTVLMGVCTGSLCAASPDNDTLPSLPAMHDYIQGVDADVALSADYRINFLNFAMIDDHQERRFSYYPNLQGAITLGARYKIFRISYSFNITTDQDYNLCYGPTRFNSFEMGIKTRFLWLEAYFSRCKGFYYSDQSILFPKFSTDSIYPQNNGLSSFEVGLRAKLIFDHDFSMEAAFDYSEIQEKSAGSFFYTLNPEISNIKSDSLPIIPPIYTPYYSGLNDFRKATFLSFSNCLGYGYSLVLGPVNFSNAIAAGPNLQLSFNHGIKVKLPFDLYFKSSLSVNTKNFYTGAMVSLDVNNHVFGQNNIRKQFLVFSFRMGFRF
ncbi:MAG TPA: DUF4421 family protein [Bacteroidales bacterium]|nr:DUF4421 family protein [Bacteroidales bacterium]